MAKKILVIDDDPSVRDAFEIALMDSGYEVAVAENGERGLEKAQNSRPDLIFLDLKMPGIGGVETLRRLKTTDQSFSVYIVTAFSLEFMKELDQARREGLGFQLASKPLSPDQVRMIAQACIGAA